MPSTTMVCKALCKYAETDPTHGMLVKACAERNVHELLSLDARHGVTMLGVWRYLEAFRTYEFFVVREHSMLRVHANVMADGNTVFVDIPTANWVAVMARKVGGEPEPLPNWCRNSAHLEPVYLLLDTEGTAENPSSLLPGIHQNPRPLATTVLPVAQDDPSLSVEKRRRLLDV